VRNVPRVAAVDGRDVLEGIEIGPPVVRHAAGIGEVSLVEFFDIRRIAAEEIAIAEISGVDRRGFAHGALTFVPLRGIRSG